MQRALFTFLDRFSETCIFLAVFAVAAISFNATLQGAFFEKFAIFFGCLLVALLAWVAQSILARKFSFVRLPAGGILVMLVSVYGASALFSDTSLRGFWGTFNDPFVGFLGMAGLCLFAFLFASRYSDRLFRATTFALVLGNLVISLGILGMPFPDGYGSEFRLTAMSVLLVGIFFIVTILSESEAKGFFAGVAQKIWTIGLFLILGASLFALGKMFTDVFWWPVFFGLGMFLLFVLSGRVSLSRGSALAVSLVIFFFTGIATFGSIAPSGSDAGRLDAGVLEKVAYASFFNRPILGYGPARYEEAYALNFPKEVNQTVFFGKRFSLAPGGMWEWISTVGSLGALLFVLLAVGCAGIVWYALKNDARSNNRDLLCFFSAGATLVPVLFFFEYNGVLLFFFFLFLGGLLGIVCRRNVWVEPRVREIALHIDPRYTLILFFTGLFFVGACVALGMRIGEKMSAGSLARAVRSETDLSVIADRLTQASARDFQESEYPRRAEEVFVAMAVTESLQGSSDAPTMERFYNLAFRYATDAERLAPWDIDVFESSARVYEAAGATVTSAIDEAVSRYVKAESLEPNNPIFPFKQGTLLLRSVQNNSKADEETKKTKLRESVDALNRAIDRAQNFPAAYYQLALTRREQKDMPRAIEAARLAVRYSSDDTTTILLLVSLLLDDPEKTQETSDLLQRAERLTPNDPAVFLYYGKWYAAQEKKDDARTAYLKAESLLPEDQKSVKDSIESLLKDLEKPKEAPSGDFPAEGDMSLSSGGGV